MTEIESLRQLQTQLHLVSDLVRSKLQALEISPDKTQSTRSLTAQPTEAVDEAVVFTSNMLGFVPFQAETQATRRERLKAFLRETDPSADTPAARERDQRNLTLTRTCREQLRELSCEVGLKEQTLVVYFIRRIHDQDFLRNVFRGFLADRIDHAATEKRDAKKLLSLYKTDDNALQQISTKLVKTTNVSDALRQIVAFFHENQQRI